MIPFYKFGILSWLSWSFFDFLPKSGLMEILPKQLDQVVIIATKPIISQGIEEIKNFEQFLILLICFCVHSYMVFSSLAMYIFLSWGVLNDMFLIFFDSNQKKKNYIRYLFFDVILLFFHIILIVYLVACMLPYEVFFCLWFYWFNYPQFLFFIKGLGLITVIIIAYFGSARIRNYFKKKSLIAFIMRFLLLLVAGTTLAFFAYTDLCTINPKELVLLAYCSYVIFSGIIFGFILLAVVLLVKEVLVTLIRILKNKFL
jgi:hypothetical protein